MDTADLEYVGFWPRVGASLVDTILVMVITFPLLTAYYGRAYWVEPVLIFGFVDFLLGWVFPIVAVIWFWRAAQATPGKMLIGAKVVDAKTGRTLTLGQCVLRYLGYIVSGVVIFLGYIWVAFDARHQGWHDKMAGSVVVRSQNREPAPVRFPEQ